MGCRAVIVAVGTTKQNANKQIGVYLHNAGSPDTVSEMLAECKRREIRGVISDPSYGWARLCQCFADILSTWSLQSEFEFARKTAFETGIGINTVSELDCHNFDNGVYYINDNFDIVKQTDGSELKGG